ncbi:MAG: SDR family oxidoreductase [Chloroflexi bacterium]|nr:SDR family oxidoreductase [Chloroflexota bacterium]
MTKLLITGGSSYLGQHLVPMALHDFDVTYTFFRSNPLGLLQGTKLDVCDETAVSTLISTHNPTVIIHLVGSNRGDYKDTIRLGTKHVTQAATQVGARLIHLSTDSIFDGTQAPYDETAVPTPINAYGRAKANAETIVKQHPNHVIVRTSLIYGLEIMDHGTSWMAAILKEGKPVTLFSNQRRNPVWANTLCAACLELIRLPFTGILNIAGQQPLSRSAFALKMFDWWQVQPRDTLNIAPSTGDQWPIDCEMDLTLATAVLTTPLLGVDDVIQQAQPN